MDERELSKLFRDAAGHPPPASFDDDDVRAASRRATARRRSALAGGSLLGVAVLGGGLLLGGQLLQPAAPEGPAGPPPAVASEPAPEPGGRTADPQPMSTLDAPRTGDGSTTGLGTCGPADPVLAAELVDALTDRGITRAGPALALAEACPEGSRAAGVPVVGGTVYLVVSPAVAGTGEGGSVRPDGARSYTVAAADNGELVSVLTIPAAPQQPAPLDEHVDELTREIAAQL
ncbi:MAG: hypothetical protein GEU83_15655 [Pseudonocardiaceae bacterium]|nr:hypothetical protein [Pseudonocardiaceae bacterium]